MAAASSAGSQVLRSLSSLYPPIPGRRGPAQPRTAESRGGAAPGGPPGGRGAEAPGSTGRAAAGARAAAARAAASGTLRTPAGANVGAVARGERPAGGFGSESYCQPHFTDGATETQKDNLLKDTYAGGGGGIQELGISSMKQ